MGESLHPQCLQIPDNPEFLIIETASECRICFFGAFPYRPRRERKRSPVVGVRTLGRRDGFEGHPNGGVRKVITSVSWCAIDFPDTTTRSTESSNIASSISIPDLIFPLPTHKAELSRRRAGTRRVKTKRGEAADAFQTMGRS